MCIRDREMGAAFLADAAMAVVVMADPLASDVWIEDAAIASIMIQLQAEDLVNRFTYYVKFRQNISRFSRSFCSISNCSL